MKLNLNQLQGLVYDEVNNVFGSIVDVDILQGTLTIGTADGQYEVQVEELTFLPVIGELNGEVIVDGDVLQVVGNDELSYEVELQEDGENIAFHLLDGEFERVEAGEAFHKDLLESLFGEVLVPVANIHELKNLVLEEETVDFNIKVVKDSEGVYFYACNNVAEEVVDLIKVVFIGAKLLEENYGRCTFDYEEYLELVAHGMIVEVSPQELQSYANQVMSGNKEERTVTTAIPEIKASATAVGVKAPKAPKAPKATPKAPKCFSDCDDECRECEKIEKEANVCGAGCNCLHSSQDDWE